MNKAGFFMFFYVFLCSALSLVGCGNVGCFPYSGGLGKNEQLFQAVIKGNVVQVRRSLNTGAWIGARDSEGRNLLHLASERGYVEIANLLHCKAGHLLFEVDKNGESPLHKAGQKGCLGMIRFLVACGAPYNTRDFNGKTPACFSAGDVVFDYFNNIESLFAAVCSDENVDGVINFLAAGIPVSVKRYDGQTLLHVASYNGAEKIVNALVSEGAFVGARDFCGRTPIQLAAFGGKLGIVKRLADFGALNLLSKIEFEELLIVAVAKGFVELVEFLVSWRLGNAMCVSWTSGTVKSGKKDGGLEACFGWKFIYVAMLVKEISFVSLRKRIIMKLLAMSHNDAQQYVSSVKKFFNFVRCGCIYQAYSLLNSDVALLTHWDDDLRSMIEWKLVMSPDVI